MSSFNIGGIVSGIDTEAMIDQLVTANSARKTIMKEKVATWEDRRDAYATLTSKLDSLKASLQDLDTVAEFRSVTGTSGDESLVKVTTAGDAVAGRYQLSVQRLATAAMEVSGGFASRSTDGAVATGTLAVTYGGTTTNVAIGATKSSLDDVADAINDQVAGVTAYVMETGDAANPYRLVVAGDDTGAENAVALDTSGLDPATGALPTFTTVTAAQDAWVKLNGVDVYDADNDLDGAVQGVTFALQDEDPASTVTVTVERDTDAMVAKIQTFVDNYNAVMSYVRSQEVYNPDEDMVGAFHAESAPDSVVSGLKSVVASTFAASSIYETLGQIGIATTQDGDLELDTDDLRTALDANFEEVVALFTDETDGFNAALQDKIDVYADADDGTLAERQSTLDDQIEDMEERIDAFESRMEDYEDRLRSQFTAMEVAMAKFEQAQNSLLALMPDFSSSKK